MSNSISSGADMSALIAQLRGELQALADRASGAMPGAGVSGPSNATPGADFASMLARAIDDVNGAQHHADTLSRAFEMGKPGVSLAQVMIAGQKADLAFTAITQVRNQLVQAYKDVMSMPI